MKISEVAISSTFRAVVQRCREYNAENKGVSNGEIASSLGRYDH